MPERNDAISHSQIDQLGQLITDLSQRLGFVERVLVKLNEINPSFADDFRKAGQAVQIEKAKTAREMLQLQRDHLIEIKAPEVIVRSKEEQLETATQLGQRLSNQSTNDWGEEHADQTEYRERLLIHFASTGAICDNSDVALDIALGLTDPKKIGTIE